ncbi:MAG: acetyl-CoA carboxylase biotin carboxyl carrier protein [Simkaniaceae bacterium]
MNREEIEKLMASMKEMGLTKIKIKDVEGFELELERQEQRGIVSPDSNSKVVHYQPVEEHYGSSHAALPKEVRTGTFIISPMVGTFYSSPGPDQEVFVKVGDRVKEDSVVCIVEAMKVMNEVKSGKSGIIREILIDNAEPVEFGTELFRID